MAEGRKILADYNHPLVTVVETMDEAADKAAELAKLLEDTEADYIAVIFDAGRKTFRNDLYKEYKAHRPEPPEDLVPQFALIRDAVRAFNVACVELPGFEADDLIASYAKAADIQLSDAAMMP